MSRTGNDVIKAGRVYSGFDYALQVWVADGAVARCGHPASVPGCAACEHAGTAVSELAAAETFPEDQHVRVFTLGPVEGRTDVCWHSTECGTCGFHQSFALRVADLNAFLGDGDASRFTYLTADEVETLSATTCSACRHRLLLDDLKRRVPAADATAELIRLLTESTGLFQRWLYSVNDEVTFCADMDDNPLAVYLRSHGLSPVRFSLPRRSAYTPQTQMKDVAGWAAEYAQAIDDSHYINFQPVHARDLLQNVLLRAVYALPFEPPPAGLLG